MLNRIFDGPPWRPRTLMFLTGALLMASFAPVGWFLLAPLLLLPLLYGFLVSTPGKAAGLGFWFGAGLFLAGTYWLYISIHVFGEAPLALAIFLMLALVVIMGLYYALTGWLIARISAGSAARLVIAAPAAWVGIEWLRGWFLSGFPWMSLGYGQIDSPLAGFAPLAGVYGLSWLVLFTACTLLLACLSPAGRAALLVAAAALPWAGGLLLGGVQWTSAAGPAVTVTLVQGGISQDRKWDADQFRPTLAFYRDSLLAHPDSSLVVWPEVAIPALLDRVEGYVDILEDDIAARGQSLLFGILERDADAEKVYNSVVLLDGSTRQVYRKRHLVPFGEYFPVPDFVREWMRLMSLPNSDISPGEPEQPLLRTPDGQRLAVAICYEDAYAAEQLYSLPEASILINVSNDAWFGDSIAPHQHLEIARMRALEVGRPAVRATNTGISTFIGADGSLSASVPQFAAQSSTGEIVPRQGLTPFARFGNLPVLALVSAGLAFGAWRERQTRMNQSKN